jgi:truncated hemoglobin YjbI
MSRLKWWGPPLVAACLLVLAMTGTFWAQDKKPLAEKHDARALRDSLKDVINTGADLFNKDGYYAGCYRLWQGALLSVKPFLAPAMQKEIDASIAGAERLPRFSDRAFALRKTLDNIRAQAAQAPPVKTDKKSLGKGPAKDKKVEAPKTTLWDRLGGAANLYKVIDDFTEAAAADPKVNISRDGKYKLDDKAAKKLEKQLVDFISSATGGPLQYTGNTMKDAHKEWASPMPNTMPREST